MRWKLILATLLPTLASVVLLDDHTPSSGAGPGAPRPRPPSSGRRCTVPRECVVEAAVGELGKSDPAPYWADTLPGVPIGKGIDWCGSFALWALHQAGLAVGVDWVLGKGFLWDTARNGWRLPITTRPEPGDIAYFEHLQHHAVIERVDGDELTLINGNGFAGAVTRSTAPLSKVTAVFSLAPLLAAEAQS